MTPESRELRLARQYLIDSGVPHRVTSTIGGKHARGSYHFRAGTDGAGLALDAAGPRPGRDTDELLAVYQALEPLGHVCAELIYAGPGGGYWKRGRKVTPYVAADHHDHVHLALPRGTFVYHSSRETVVPEDIIVDAPIVAVIGSPDGKGYAYVLANGAVYAFGSAVYAGRIIVPESVWKS